MFERLDTWANKIPWNVRIGVVALVGMATLRVALQSFVWPLMATPSTLAPVSETVDGYDTNRHGALSDAVFNIRLDGNDEPHTAFLWDDNGHLLVPAHAIANCRMLDVQLPNGTHVRGRVVGYDLMTNIGVIAIDASHQLGSALPKRTHPINIGEAVSIFEMAEGQSRFLAGTVERTNRVINVETRNGYAIPLPDALVIRLNNESRVQPNAGVFDTAQRLVGITVRTPVQSTTFMTRTYALAMPAITHIVDDIITTGEHAYPWLGFAGETIDPSMSAILGLPPEGVYVLQVLNGSPADQAGLQGVNTLIEINNRQFRAGGDVIVAVDGRPVRSMEDLIVQLMYESEPGDTITLTVVRGRTEKTLTVVVGKRPNEMFLH
nr:S1C family serine protease [Ardenticatena sp.]